MNNVIVSGYLGDDPKPIEKGFKLSVAVKDIKESYWVDVVDFSGQDLSLMLKKGSKVLIKGRLIQTVPKTKIVTERIEFL